MHLHLLNLPVARCQGQAWEASEPGDLCRLPKMRGGLCPEMGVLCMDRLQVGSRIWPQFYEHSRKLPGAKIQKPLDLGVLWIWAVTPMLPASLVVSVEWG